LDLVAKKGNNDILKRLEKYMRCLVVLFGCRERDLPSVSLKKIIQKQRRVIFLKNRGKGVTGEIHDR